MSARSPLLRGVRLLALLLQLGLPSLGVYVDAHLEAEAATAALHVESQDHDCHPPAHPDHCALCQFLRAPLLPAADPRPAAAVVPAARIAASSDFSSRSRDLVPTLPRGPPRLS